MSNWSFVVRTVREINPLFCFVVAILSFLVDSRPIVTHIDNNENDSNDNFIALRMIQEYNSSDVLGNIYAWTKPAFAGIVLEEYMWKMIYKYWGI